MAILVFSNFIGNISSFLTLHHQKNFGRMILSLFLFQGGEHVLLIGYKYIGPIGVALRAAVEKDEI